MGLILTSALGAWLLRFDFVLPPAAIALVYCPILILLRMAALNRFDLLHGYWRHSGIDEIVDIVRAVGAGSLAFFLATRWLIHASSFPRSIYLLEAITTAGALTGVRAVAMFLDSRGGHQHKGARMRRVIVIGAGATAASLLREMSKSEFLPVACLDDDKFKRGGRVRGVPVVGGIEEIGRVAEEFMAEEIFIAIPSATGSQMRRITTLCAATKLECRTVPSMRDLLAGKMLVSQLREINVEDLLGRDPIQLDLTTLRRQIEGKVVMVTGAAGSIGSELCRQLLREAPARLIALDQAETALFYLQLQLTKENHGNNVRYFVEDIANTVRMRQVLATEGVDIIFHAAAYKHVPMVENNLRAALSNNVFALRNLLDVAEESGCNSFVLISTDKAVHPSSFMGATKRLGELMMAAQRERKMRCVAVRFGNVLGSQGSVIPVFKEQIEKEGRITVTHPDITRYFMTIPEAVSLVLQAFTIGDHGDILVLDMGSPVRIMDLAHSLIRMCGKTPSEVQIDITGLRQGEKLYEELFYARERLFPTSHKKVKRTQSDILPWAVLEAGLDELASLATYSSDVTLRSKVKDMIPEYTYEHVVDQDEARETVESCKISLPVMARTAVATGNAG
ncbi:MAG TPA: nucleoside-diphosphate sugar epimerase/dehydratase [Terriglobales bacterium]|nr:nucleoside-diphosphate sugar epimerase/dehydratase [Terriglobales bacterium]